MGFHLLQKSLINSEGVFDLNSAEKLKVKSMIKNWSLDPEAPMWVNRIEDAFTIRGDWNKSIVI